tara:strand:- start:2066 stop:2632 length:567 start_codon:yes stop_codon:yes gene_type:complete
MRIIGGNFRGKKIILPIDKKTRPLRDLVKESIFNLISHSKIFSCVIHGSNILDLFSGSGSFGLECYSRGASKVFFIENYPEVLKVLKKNVKSICKDENCKIVDKNCFSIFEKKNFFKYKFDIIFIDPPYKEKKINYLLDRIYENKILKNSGLVIIHRHKKDNVEISNRFKVIDQRSYGISKIILGTLV